MDLPVHLKKLLRKTLASFGVGITSATNLARLTRYQAIVEDLDFVLKLEDEHVARVLRALPFSKSQFHQDLFAISEVDFKREGYFVEFGATNGLDLSNTHMLESHFGWTGILAEPARCWHGKLSANRRCVIEKRCVWKSSGSRLLFNETDDAILSTLQSYSGSDIHRNARRAGKQYEVETISLQDMLDTHKAPSVIDYLSIDTEGSEFEILSSLDFTRYQFRVITCEHNFTHKREAIFDLLSAQGYRRKLSEISGVDDWYVRN